MKFDPILLNFAYKLLWAAFFGALIGIEREVSKKPAGMRTYALISLGACIFSSITILFSHSAAHSIDMTRIAAQIVMGVGFIGAGTIMHSGTSVEGLTTAAAIWTNAAIGTMVGLGYIAEAAVATAVVIMIVLLLSPIEIFIVKRLQLMNSKTQKKK